METTVTSTNRVTTRNKVGLGIAALLGLIDCASLLFTTAEGEVGPPVAILVLTTLCGIVTLVAVGPAWRSGDRVATRVTAGARIVSALTALPAFFVDIPAGVVVITAALVVLTVVSVVLMMTPARRPSPVLD